MKNNKKLRYRMGSKIVTLIVRYLPYCKKQHYCHRCKMEPFCYTLQGKQYLIGREK